MKIIISNSVKDIDEADAIITTGEIRHIVRTLKSLGVGGRISGLVNRWEKREKHARKNHGAEA